MLSAGIGRTGTLMTIFHALQFIRNPQFQANIEKVMSLIPKLVLYYRTKRAYLVSNESQYSFIYQAIFNFVIDNYPSRS